ncbi:MAG: YbhB/YbcL family Raf kinase inhibitor-like protein [Candidatus Caldatribacteriaceae bacterium]
MSRWVWFVTLCILGVGSLLFAQEEPVFRLKSEGLSLEAPIPLRYTCFGENVSPPFTWENVPPGTVSLVLLCEDPDAPQGTFVHWVVYNLPPELSLQEGAGTIGKERIAEVAYQGRNSFGKIGYGGPCPPPGNPHRYVFRLLALDTVLPQKPGLTEDEVLSLIAGHILGEARFLGIFGWK